MQRNHIIAAIVAAIIVVVALVAFFVVKPRMDASNGTATTEEDPAALVANDRVVARVNGTDIHLSDVALAEEEMGQSLAQIPEQMRFQYLLGMLIDRRVVSLEGKEAGVEKDPLVRTRADYYAERALRDVYWVRTLKDALNDDKLKAYYDANIANAPVEQEAHAAHILVTTKAEAEKVLADLKAGKSFADLAKERSKDGSAKNGGDLGWYKKSELVPDFGNAVFALKAGETSGAVQSGFGWHVIRLFEIRDAKTPTFDEARQGIIRTLARSEGEALLATLRAKDKIELVKEDGTSEIVSAQDEAEVPAPADAAPTESAPEAEAPVEEVPAAEEAPATETPAAE
jgi:peptidyl-prolyl cis-trans isomerase C